MTFQDVSPFFSGQKRPSEGNSGLLAKKQKRTPKRTSAVAKNEKNGTGWCFSMLACTVLIFSAVRWLDHLCQFKNKFGLLYSKIAIFPFIFNLRCLSILFRTKIAVIIYYAYLYFLCKAV